MVYTSSNMGSHYKFCVCFTRSFHTAELKPPPDVVDIFKKYATGNSMNAEDFRRFLMEDQGEYGLVESAMTVADSEKIIEQVLKRHHHHINFMRRKELSVEDFLFFLFSVELNPPITSQVHQDMKAPISHYFIYTGHNSYLTGNQLSSDCSDVPIINALQRGVRVIELDLWPNPTTDDVHVLHGRTLTCPVTLIKCLHSIKNHAFVASEYPVILTLEDHLTPPLQAKVAKMLTETFGEMLYYPESETESSVEFPSPEDLKYKVIVSTKPPKEYLVTKDSMDGKVVTKDNSISEGKDDSGGHVSDKSPLPLEANAPKENSKLESDDEDEVVINEADEYENTKVLQDSSPPGYKSLITIVAVPRRKLEESLKGDPNKVARLSLNEQALEKAANFHGTDVVRFTQRNILRIFPKTTRFDSSNYDPLIGWMHGAQMVAFNMQGHGKLLWRMQGMFKANGGCGYVKKPDFLLNLGSDSQVFDPKAKLPVKKTLKVKVYMGDGWQLDFKRTHFDSYSPPDFYVRIGIAGVPADEIMKKTKIKEDQWIPVWNEEFEFPLTVPELALLRIEVLEYDMSEKDDFGGQTCLPVFELKSGIHSVPLYDHKGEKYPSVKLLMGFQFA